MPITGNIVINSGSLINLFTNSDIPIEIVLSDPQAPFTYVGWNITSQPVGSTVFFSKHTEAESTFRSDMIGDYTISCAWGSGGESGVEYATFSITQAATSINQSHKLVEAVGTDKCGTIGVEVTSNEPFNKINGVDITSTLVYTIDKARDDGNFLITINATADGNANSRLSNFVAPFFTQSLATGSVINLDVVLSTPPSGLTFMYNYGEGGGFVNENNYSYTTEGEKIITFRDQYDCSNQIKLITSNRPIIDNDDYKSNFYTSKANSIRLVKREEVVNCGNYQNDENSFGYEVKYKELTYCDKHRFKKCNVIRNQFQSSYDTNIMKVWDSNDNLIDTPSIYKVQQNLKITDSRPYLYLEDTNYSYIYFDQFKAIPSFYKVGGFITIDAEIKEIIGLVYLEDNDLWAIKTLKFTAYTGATVDYTYNRQEYDVFEFDFDAVSYGVGEYYITYQGERTTASSSIPEENKTIDYTSIPIVLELEFEGTADLIWWGDVNNDVYYESGVVFFMTIGLDYRISVPSIENEVISTDLSSYVKKVDGKEKFEFLFEPTTLEVMRKLEAGLSQFNVSIDGVMYAFDSVQHESIGDQTNDYIIKATGFKVGVILEFDSNLVKFDFSSGLVTWDSGKITMDATVYEV